MRSENGKDYSRKVHSSGFTYPGQEHGFGSKLSHSLTSLMQVSPSQPSLQTHSSFREVTNVQASRELQDSVPHGVKTSRFRFTNAWTGSAMLKSNKKGAAKTTKHFMLDEVFGFRVSECRNCDERVVEVFRACYHK